MGISTKNLISIIVLAHLAHILFGLIALPLTLLTKNFYIWSLVYIGATLASWIVAKDCILLEWENKLRKQHDPQTVYEGAYISHYLKKYFSINISTRTVRTIIYSYMAILLVVSLLKYYTLK